jgi:lysophospholipase L1-like esterase
MKTKIIASLMLLATAMCAQTVWMIGDSTMASYKDNQAPLTGWGQMLGEYCKPGVKIQNKAVSGWSTTMFMAKDEKTGKSRFDSLVDQIKPGDYLIVQFGHNDQKKSAPKQYASPEQYREYMMFFADEAKKRGATPVFATSVCRRQFKGDSAISTLAEYPAITRELAKNNGIALVDLNAITQAEYTKLGPEDSKKLFKYVKEGESPYWDKQIEKEKAKSKTPGLHVDDTHFNRSGATTVAGWFVDDAKKQNLPIAELFK